MSLLEQAKLYEQPAYASWVAPHILTCAKEILNPLSWFMNLESFDGSKTLDLAPILHHLEEIFGAFVILDLVANQHLLEKLISILKNTDEKELKPNSLILEQLAYACFIIEDQALRLEDGQTPPLSPVMGLLKQLGVPVWTKAQFTPQLASMFPRHPTWASKTAYLEQAVGRQFLKTEKDEFLIFRDAVWQILTAPLSNLEIEFIRKFHLNQYWSASETYSAHPITEPALIFSEQMNSVLDELKFKIDAWPVSEKISKENIENAIEDLIQLQNTTLAVGLSEREAKLGMAIELLRSFSVNQDRNLLFTVAHIFERLKATNLDLILLGTAKTREAPGRRHALKTIHLIQTEAENELRQIHNQFSEALEKNEPLKNIKTPIQNLSGLMHVLGIKKVAQYLDAILRRNGDISASKMLAEIIAITDGAVGFLNTHAPFLEDLKIPIQHKAPATPESKAISEKPKIEPPPLESEIVEPTPVQQDPSISMIAVEEASDISEKEEVKTIVIEEPEPLVLPEIEITLKTPIVVEEAPLELVNSVEPEVSDGFEGEWVSLIGNYIGLEWLFISDITHEKHFECVEKLKLLLKIANKTELAEKINQYQLGKMEKQAGTELIEAFVEMFNGDTIALEKAQEMLLDLKQRVQTIKVDSKSVDKMLEIQNILQKINEDHSK